eukprot:245880-Prorocentrum_minimum.AAC.1
MGLDTSKRDSKATSLGVSSCMSPTSKHQLASTSILTRVSPPLCIPSSRSRMLSMRWLALCPKESVRRFPK